MVDTSPLSSSLPAKREDVEVEYKLETKGTGHRLSSSTTCFIVSPSGILMIINWILLLLYILALFISLAKIEGADWFTWAEWVDNYPRRKRINGTVLYHESFFLLWTLTPLILFIALFVIFAFGVHKRKTRINWPLTMSINCDIWALCLLIAKHLIIERIERPEYIEYDDYQYTDDYRARLRLVLAFGDLPMIGLIVQGGLHFFGVLFQRIQMHFKNKQFQ